jgi:hypothetical protein
MRGIFGATDAALLTQGKDNKSKSAAFGRFSGALSLSRISHHPQEGSLCWWRIILRI